VWYPARTGGRAMRYRDYLALTAEEKTLKATDAQRDESVKGFAGFLRAQKVSEPSIAEYVDSPMLARRDRRSAQGLFPVVIIVQGNGESASDQAVLAEILASHGHYVATFPSITTLTGPMKTEDDIGPKATAEAGNIARAIKAVSGRRNADATHVILIGHSLGARSALLYAMQNKVDGLVSLDGGIGTAVGIKPMEASPLFRRKNIPPILHLYQTTDERVKPEFTFLKSLDAPALDLVPLPGLLHHHFSTFGFAAAADPEIAKATKAGAEVGASMRGLVKRVVQFAGR
jgi:dienelactone hydrolase